MIVKNTENNKYWRGCEKLKPHGGMESGLAPVETYLAPPPVWHPAPQAQFVKHRVATTVSSPSCGFTPESRENIHPGKRLYTRLIEAKWGDPCRRPSRDHWVMDAVWYFGTVRYYLAIQGDPIPTATWVLLENTKLVDRKRPQEATHYMTSLMGGVRVTESSVRFPGLRGRRPWARGLSSE